MFPFFYPLFVGGLGSFPKAVLLFPTAFANSSAFHLCNRHGCKYSSVLQNAVPQRMSREVQYMDMGGGMPGVYGSISPSRPLGFADKNPHL